MKKTVFIVLLLSMGLFAGKINIAVAANVSYAIDDLIAEFNKTNPLTKVAVTLGSSGKLTAQIKNGAPYTLFMAANMKYPEALYQENLTHTKPIIYAQGALAILSIQGLDLKKGIMLATQSSVEKIAIANPKTAPYGKATLEAMKNASIHEVVKSKYVYAETISQAVTYALMAADMGFIAKSSLYGSTMSKYKQGVHWRTVDSTLYTPINQGIVILKRAEKNSEVKAFYDFILSQRAKKIFKEFGYLVP